MEESESAIRHCSCLNVVLKLSGIEMNIIEMMYSILNPVVTTMNESKILLKMRYMK